MGRKRVKHELIADESARRASFKKRKAGLLKKICELKTLCGVSACAIITSSYDPEPVVWPSPPEASRLVDQFKEIRLETKGKYKMDQEDVLCRNVSKISQALERQRKKNRKHEMELILATQGLPSQAEIDCYDSANVTELLSCLDEQIKSVADKIEDAYKPQI